MPIICITFRSISKRNEVIRSYRKIKNLYLYNNNQCKIFINESLSPSRRRLFLKTKLFSKEMKYKYVWIRNGEIYMRKDDGSNRIVINQFTDFADFVDAKDSDRLD